MEVILLIIILALIAVIAWLFISSKKPNESLEELISLRTSLEHKTTECQRLTNEVNSLRQELESSRINLSKCEGEMAQLRNDLIEAKASQESLADFLEDRFRGITTKLIDERSEMLHKRSEESLKPLREDLKRFGEQVQNAYQNEARERGSLQAEIRLLVEHGRKMSEEANNLTKALKGDNKIQGDWGEMILENILASSGLRRGAEYTIQETLRDETGKVIHTEDSGSALRPDVIVHYPNGGKVIIDSKVSLKAFANYVAAENDEERERYAREHLASVRSQINLLSSKEYYANMPESAEFVMLFIPNEPAYILAMKLAPNLWEEAYKKKVVLINGTNLLAALSMARDLWQRDTQMKNIEKIFREVGALYDKFCGYLDTLDAVEKKFKDANTALEKARGQLSEGRGNMITKMENLRKMGAKVTKQLPSYLLDSEAEE